jgi:hypothetical protein
MCACQSVVGNAGGHEQGGLKAAWLKMWNTATTAARVPGRSGR